MTKAALERPKATEKRDLLVPLGENLTVNSVQGPLRPIDSGSIRIPTRAGVGTRSVCRKTS